MQVLYVRAHMRRGVEHLVAVGARQPIVKTSFVQTFGEVGHGAAAAPVVAVAVGVAVDVFDWNQEKRNVT
jgi:hypothetical protein